MSALPKDEFTLEMRNHFLDGTFQLLGELKQDPAFPQRFSDLCQEWQSECNSNELPWLSDMLEQVSTDWKTAFPSAQEVEDVCGRLCGYLSALKLEADTETLRARFANTTAVSVEEAASIEEKAATYLQCRYGEHRFLLPVENVVEISRSKTINPLPHADSRLEGLIGFRGQGTPVFKLESARVSATSGTTSEKTFFVICEHKGSFFALKVHSTDDIFKVKASEFQASTLQASSNGHLGQFVARGDQIIVLLDIAMLVSA